ncbi:type II secretion system protein GspD [Deinococcus roseus]|uniref:Secretin n=1 Tax=Deinococcus roseus TaxID=392414 RepID=A0ABQ2CZR2_9DEIO|nr:type II secretion system protein GspD [Deinococcus roseus]GGJ33155.1 hypothetical protein GCM10008938_19250 [Deinococcus roseus]
MKRTALISLLLTLASLAQAATLKADYSKDSQKLALVSPERIAYKAEAGTHNILISNASLDETTPLPEGFKAEVVGNDLKITIPDNYQVSLSPTNTSLFFVPVPGSTVQQVDDRAPLFIPLSSASPSQVASLLNGMYSNLKIQVDDRQRALLIMVNPQDRELILKVVKQLDQARPQVMFEAEILEINQGTTTQLGIKYDDLFTLKLSEGDSGSFLKFGKVDRTPLSLSLGISALKANNAAKVLAQPRVTTLDGVEARINSTQTQPVILSSQNGSQSVTNITTGISLRFLPKVGPDGIIEASLNIVVSVPTGMVNNVTTYSSRDASTTVRVKNGEPIVIGGLLESRTLNSTSKVPLLGDIPILGALFTHNSTQTSSSDLMIIVTPRLITSPEQP